MLAIFSTSEIKKYAYLIFALLIVSGCADIKLQPKDPELMGLGNFANQATMHLFEMDPSTYEQYQKLLEREYAPNVLAELRKHGACVTTASEAKQKVAVMQKNDQRCVINIESTTFPSKATAQGLIPIEVKGTCVKSIGSNNKNCRFDVLYLIGTNIKTKEPVVASLEIKKFD